MIIKAEIINQPYSGEFKEKIFDIPSAWNSPFWTWVRFEDEDGNEWCGNFRGTPKSVAVSKKHRKILILTSDHLFQLDAASGELTDYESQTEYQSLTVAPSGDFILADYFGIEKIASSLKEKTAIKSPFEMNQIEFHGWSNNKLLITCTKLRNWSNNVELQLDGNTFKMTAKACS